MTHISCQIFKQDQLLLLVPTPNQPNRALINFDMFLRDICVIIRFFPNKARLGIGIGIVFHGYPRPTLLSKDKYRANSKFYAPLKLLSVGYGFGIEKEEKPVKGPLGLLHV